MANIAKSETVYSYILRIKNDKLVCASGGTTAQQKEMLKAKHPNCEVVPMGKAGLNFASDIPAEEFGTPREVAMPTEFKKQLDAEFKKQLDADEE